MLGKVPSSCYICTISEYIYNQSTPIMRERKEKPIVATRTAKSAPRQRLQTPDLTPTEMQMVESYRDKLREETGIRVSRAAAFCAAAMKTIKAEVGSQP